MANHDATWLFDLGNSRLKGACSGSRELEQAFALAWDAPDFDAVLQVQLSRWPPAARALIASVAPSARAERLHSALQAWPGMDAQWLRSPRQGCGITTYYRTPERLGIDRFLAMAAARAAADQTALIVVGCGTALTLDALDVNGFQQQGLIAPSPELMLRSLQMTAMADSHRDAFGDAESDDTARALHAGCARAAAALVGWHCAHQRAAIGAAAPLYLHGGWAVSLQAMLEESRCDMRIVLLENAVLRGLALWAQG